MTKYQRENEEGRAALQRFYNVLQEVFSRGTPEDWISVSSSLEPDILMVLHMMENPLTRGPFEQETVVLMKKIKRLLDEMQGREVEEDDEESSDS